MDQSLQKFNQLPKETKDRLSAPAVLNAIVALEKKYRVKLTVIFIKLAVGDLPRLGLSGYLATRLGLSPVAAGEIEREFAKILPPEVKTAANYAKIEKTSAPQPAPAASSAAKANLVFSVEDEKEINGFKNLNHYPAQTDYDGLAQKIISQFGDQGQSGERRRRLVNIVVARLKEVRDDIETLEVLKKKAISGGLEFEEEEADRLLKLTKAVLGQSAADNHSGFRGAARIIFPIKKSLNRLGLTIKEKAQEEKEKIRVVFDKPSAFLAQKMSGEDSPVSRPASQSGAAINGSRQAVEMTKPAKETAKPEPSDAPQKPIPPVAPKEEFLPRIEEEDGLPVLRLPDDLMIKPKETGIRNNEFGVKEDKKPISSPEADRQYLRQRNTQYPHPTSLGQSPGGQAISNITADRKENRKEQAGVSSAESNKKQPTPYPYLGKKSLPPKIARASVSRKPTLDDVKFAPKLTGPVEELKGMTLIDFRRLAGTPAGQTREIQERIDLLENESYGRKCEGIAAWQQSEVNRFYRLLGQASLTEGRGVAEIIENRLAAGKPTLSLEEFEAVMELNRKLRY